jgi:hypothetical protein
LDCHAQLAVPEMIEPAYVETSRAQLRGRGFVIIPDIVSASDCNKLATLLERPAVQKLADAFLDLVERALPDV